MKTTTKALLIILWAFALFIFATVFAMRACAQSATCANNDQLVLNTSTKTYQCITPGALPAGSGTTMVVANASVTGTTVNRLAKLTGAPSTAVVTATTDTENAIGIVTSGAGTTGNATITILGQASCEFDGATTAGNYFTISATTAGKCHDAGSAFPTSGATYGRVLSTNGAGGTFVVEIMTPDVAFQNAGNGKSRPGGSSGDFQWNNSNVFAGGGPLSRVSASQVSLSASGDSFRFFSAGPTLTGTSLQLELTNGVFKASNVFSGTTFYLGGNAGNQNGGLQFSNSNQLMWASGNVTGGGQAIEVAMGRDTTGRAEINDGTLTQLGSATNARDLKLRHAIASGAAPTIASGFGTGSTIAGRDEAFRVTAGTSPGTGGVVTFAVAYTNAPICVATDETTTTVIFNATPTTTNVTLTVAAGILLASDKIGVLCRGYLTN